MHETSSIELALSISAKPLPLIFLDTASILDIVRVPFRTDLQVNILNSAASLVDEVATVSASAWVVSTSNVLQEFHANRQGVLEELSARVANLAVSVARLSSVASLVFPERQIGNLDWLDDKFEVRVVGVMDRLVSSLTIFRGTDECIVRARNRLWAGLPPASKSKREFKDCEIFEEFLELGRALRRSNFDESMLFVSSNTNDYGKPPEGYKQITSDLEEVGARFIGDLAWARAILRGPSTKAALDKN